MRIASFDIGKKNFAFCIEEFDEKLLQNLKVPTVSHNRDGTVTAEMQKVLDSVFENGELVLHENLDLTKNCDKKKKLDPETFHNMTEVLNARMAYWDTCDAFIIEEQMAFAGKNNLMAVKLGQHCYSFFAIKYGKKKRIVEFPSYHKTQVLGAPMENVGTYKNGNVKYKSMSKPARKKWGIEVALEILNGRGDEETIEKMSKKKKLDDLADVLIQLQAYKILTFCK